MTRPPPSYVATVIAVLEALRSGPRRPSDLARKLEVTRRTVDRVLRGLEGAGAGVQRVKRGREVWYWIGGEP